jgi:hypothetical protein
MEQSYKQMLNQQNKPEEDYKRAIRLLWIYRKFLEGNILDSHHLKTLISKEFGEVSLRTIQRDLKILKRLGLIAPTPKRFEPHKYFWKLAIGERILMLNNLKAMSYGNNNNITT